MKRSLLSLFTATIQCRGSAIAMLLVAIGTAAGCSGSSSSLETPEDLIPVTGTLILDGEPARGVAMNFVPEIATSGQGGWAVTDDSGAFIVRHYSNADGVPPGTYRVTFSRLRLPSGDPLPEGVDAADVGAVETLPRHLTQSDIPSPQHVVTVSPTSEKVTLEISTTRSRRS